MDNIKLKLIISIRGNGLFKEGTEVETAEGNKYRHDRGFLKEPNDYTLGLFNELANGSTQFFSGNYSFFKNADNILSFIKYVDLESKASKVMRKIKDTKGKFFTVTFVKKDGSERKMTARVGVKKGVKNVGQKYVPSDKSLVTVYAMDKLNFRMVNLNTVKSITFQKLITTF